MKTLLICHADAPLDREGLALWLASFSDLVGMIVLHEDRSKLVARSKREIKRVGLLRFLDVVAFRVYYKLALARKDAAAERLLLESLRARYPALPADLPVLHTPSPNSAEAEQFLKEHRPDLMIARCKVILRKRIFTIPTRGTFVMHPGICPEYRNAHGCFWALAEGDTERVGMTLLQIDEGVDTGPVYGFFSYPYDERRESHIVIQARTVLDNLDAIRDKLTEIVEGRARTLDVRGHGSAVWGQPWLTKYAGWKIRARRKAS
jgi:Formyl transferase